MADLRTQFDPAVADRAFALLSNLCFFDYETNKQLSWRREGDTAYAKFSSPVELMRFVTLLEGDPKTPRSQFLLPRPPMSIWKSKKPTELGAEMGKKTERGRECEIRVPLTILNLENLAAAQPIIPNPAFNPPDLNGQT